MAAPHQGDREISGVCIFFEGGNLSFGGLVHAEVFWWRLLGCRVAVCLFVCITLCGAPFQGSRLLSEELLRCFCGPVVLLSGLRSVSVGFRCC